MINKSPEAKQPREDVAREEGAGEEEQAPSLSSSQQEGSEQGESNPQEASSENNNSKLDFDQLMEWLRPIQDPEIGFSLVDLGLVYHVELDNEGTGRVQMTLTSPGCPAGDYIVDQVSKRMEELPQVKKAEVNIVWEPRWDPREMASEEVKEVLGIW